MTEMVQQPFTVTMVTPRQICASSWWIDAKPDGFTAFCRQQVFRETLTDREQRRAAGIAAEQQMTAETN